MIGAEIDKYYPEDAGEVSVAISERASLDRQLDRFEHPIPVDVFA